jgi:hypothetical protein
VSARPRIAASASDARTTVGATQAIDLFVQVAVRDASIAAFDCRRAGAEHRRHAGVVELGARQPELRRHGPRGGARSFYCFAR